MGGELHNSYMLRNYSEKNSNGNFSDPFLSDNTSRYSCSLDHNHPLFNSVVYQKCHDSLTLSEDPTVADDNEFDQSHIFDYQEENISKQVLYEVGIPEKTMNKSDCETCDENSLNEGHDLLEDITEHSETFSDDETVQIIEDNLSCGRIHSIESISSTPSKTSSCSKEEISSPFTSQNPKLQHPGTFSLKL
ncbi:FERM, ARHGEF and pleckstrin domain-containing protein 2 [Nephila pilipes]|uniref:FERM, ARHGEF and pleckstrin domain-containing protein 2 n=1 Tax=Nephila pilipes TaxID=299642 RepID=A0A8X6TSD1_NEPPI|nr:FERM, ARHGEF and pleckstrin domain-containing protein 2 [Nephila pilipes]GFT50666.1 FERM, ARHGEF and pleckstrin domain-containing protein 2 [Nephila pilipes]